MDCHNKEQHSCSCDALLKAELESIAIMIHQVTVQKNSLPSVSAGQQGALVEASRH